MTVGLARALGAATLLIGTVALADPVEYLFHNERVCDSTDAFCIRGTLTYRSNPRLFHLRARVRSAPGPGLLRIRLAGANELGHLRFAPFEVRVRGHPSEIIDHKMIPDHPDVSEWNVEKVDFTADDTNGTPDAASRQE